MKIVERLVRSQLYYYLSYNHLLSPSHHGFRPRHSTETALTAVTDQILTAADGGNIRGKWGKADYLRNSMQYFFTECLYLTTDFSIG